MARSPPACQTTTPYAHPPAHQLTALQWHGLEARKIDVSLPRFALFARNRGGLEGVEEAADVVVAETVAQVAEHFHGVDHLVEGGAGRLDALVVGGEFARTTAAARFGRGSVAGVFAARDR